MIRTVVIAFTCALALTAAGAQATTLEIVRGSSITLEGRTNVHPWRCESDGIRGSLQTDAPWSVLEIALTSASGGPAGSLVRDLPAGITLPQPSFSASIPVQSFDCGNRLMENDLRKALKAEQSPLIRFRYVDLVRVTTETARSGALASWYLSVEVELRLAGATRRIPMELRVDRASRTTFRLHGSTQLRMTDFGITPPTGMFGMIRAADELDVTVSLLLQPE